MKKRSISLILAAIMLMTAIAFASVSVNADVELPIIPLKPDDPTPRVPCGPGDANGDGTINAQDVLAIMKYNVGKAEIYFFPQYADYDGNGRINAKDVLSLMLDIVNGEV